MSTRDTQSLNPTVDGQGKDKQFIAKLQRVYKALQDKPMTMKETDVYAGVIRENICRYINTLYEKNKIAILRKRKCTITGYSY